MAILCANINDKDYQALAAVVGEARAHTIWNANNGNPISLNADGTPSVIFNTLMDRHGSKAYSMRAKMFSDEYMMLKGKGKVSDSIDEYDNVTMPDGMLYALRTQTSNDPVVNRQRIRNEFLDTGKMAQSMIKNLSRTIPGMHIIIEDNNTVKGTIHSNERAWIDNDGVHMNVTSLHYTTPVHEMTHLWLHVLENTDTDKHRLLMGKIEDSMKDNKDIVQALQVKYPHLTQRQLEYEYAATVSGFASAEKVKQFFLKNDVVKPQSRIESIFDTFKAIVNDLLGHIKTILGIDEQTYISAIDFNTASLNDVFEALTKDYISGNNILGMSRDEMQGFMDKYYSDHYEAEKNNDDEKKRITNINDILPHAINNDDVTISGKNPFDNEEYKRNMATSIFNMLNIDRKNGNRFYYSFNKRYDFPIEWNAEETIQRIITDVIPGIQTMITSFNDNIKEVLRQHLTNTKRPIEEIIASVFSNFKLSESKTYEIKSALTHLGLNEPVVDIMNYSELANKPGLSHLFKQSLVGYDPLIIVHGHTNDELDISIIDLASGVLGRQDNILSTNQVNLGSKFGAPNSQFSYSNSKADIRRVLVATTLAGMNKLATENNMSLRIRKTGVIGFQGRKVNPYMIRNIDEAFKNGRALFRLPEVVGLMSNDNPDIHFFRELLEDDHAWSGRNIHQSWKNILESYYSAYYMELGLTAEERDLFLEDVGSWKHYEVLHRRKRQIERKKERTWINDPEHKLLTQYLLFKKRGMTIYNSQVEDIDPTFLKVTNVHNIKSDILQHFSIVAEASKSKVVTQTNEYKDKFATLLEASLQSHGNRIKAVGNLPEKVFGHFFKTAKVHIVKDSKKYKKGEVVEVKLYNQLHGSHDLAAAKAAGMTKEDIALADYIIATVRERYIANKLHDAEQYASSRTKEDIIAEVDKQLIPGSIVVLPSTETELMRKGKVGKGITKKIQKIINAEYMPGDFISDDFNEIHSLFNNQIDFHQQLKNIGLKTVRNEHNPSEDDSYVEIDMDKYEDSTMNLEYVFNMFVLDSTRKIEFETNVIPAYNEAKQWMNIISSEYGMNKFIQKHTNEFLEQYKERIIDKKNRDPNTRLAGITRTVISAYSYISLGYRPTVWMRSAYYNAQNQMLNALAASAIENSTPEEKKLKFPTVANVLEANTLIFKDFKKVYELGKRFAIVNSTEMDVIESFFTTNIDKNIFKNQVAHIGNYYSDVAARLITMTAFMLQDGSYEAHTYNEKTGKISYDIRKDKRFYEDGKWKSDEAKIIHNDIMERQRMEGQLVDGKQVIGYDYEELNTRFKWYVDKYIIGSMDEYQKVLLGNTYTGQLFTQFRLFSFDKFFNYVGTTRQSYYGATTKVKKNSEGELVAIREQIRNEGTIASLWGLMKDVHAVIKLNGLSPQEIYETIHNADPVTRYNLHKSLANTLLFITILGGLKLAVDMGMTDRDRRKLEWLYGNLMVYQEMVNIEQSMIPIAGLVETMLSLITGRGNALRQVLRYTGPVNDAIWYYELFTTDDMVVPTNRQQKKINEMNEKELEAYRRKQEQKRKRDLEAEEE